MPGKEKNMAAPNQIARKELGGIIRLDFEKNLIEYEKKAAIIKGMFSKRNRKLKDSYYDTPDDSMVISFGIPTIRASEYLQTTTQTTTCPSAGSCTAYCYASKRAFSWFNRIAKEDYLFYLSYLEPKLFIDRVLKEIDKYELQATEQNKKLFVRIHDSGDFYDSAYMLNWFHIIESKPFIQFYAYTKEHQMFFERKDIPDNLYVIYSAGSRDDSLLSKIKASNLPIATIEKVNVHYKNDCSKNDLKALQTNTINLSWRQ